MKVQVWWVLQMVGDTEHSSLCILLLFLQHVIRGIIAEDHYSRYIAEMTKKVLLALNTSFKKE